MAKNIEDLEGAFAVDNDVHVVDEMAYFSWPCGRKKTVFGDNDDVFQKLIVPLPIQTKHVRIMTALQMNAELFRQLSIIAEDESLMAKMLKYAKKLAAKKEEMDKTMYLMSSPAMAEIIRQGQEDIKNGRGEVVKVEDLWK